MSILTPLDDWNSCGRGPAVSKYGGSKKAIRIMNSSTIEHSTIMYVCSSSSSIM